jgi:hypothetical protein
MDVNVAALGGVMDRTTLFARKTRNSLQKARQAPVSEVVIVSLSNASRPLSS